MFVLGEQAIQVASVRGSPARWPHGSSPVSLDEMDLPMHGGTRGDLCRGGKSHVLYTRAKRDSLKGWYSDVVQNSSAKLRALTVKFEVVGRRIYGIDVDRGSFPCPRTTAPLNCSHRVTNVRFRAEYVEVSMSRTLLTRDPHYIKGCSRTFYLRTPCSNPTNAFVAARSVLSVR